MRSGAQLQPWIAGFRIPRCDGDNPRFGVGPAEIGRKPGRNGSVTDHVYAGPDGRRTDYRIPDPTAVGVFFSALMPVSLFAGWFGRLRSGHFSVMIVPAASRLSIFQFCLIFYR